MGYIVVFKHLAGIPNVALLVRPIVRNNIHICCMLLHACHSICGMLIGTKAWNRGMCALLS